MRGLSTTTTKMPSAVSGPDGPGCDGVAGHDHTPVGSGAEGGAAMLYILACPLPSAEGRPAYLLHKVGRVDCVLGYTDLSRLVECCGPHQPWLAVRLEALIADLKGQH